MNKLLMEENDRLQKQVSQLVYDNGFMRQKLHTVSLINFLPTITSLLDLLRDLATMSTYDNLLNNCA